VRVSLSAASWTPKSEDGREGSDTATTPPIVPQAVRPYLNDIQVRRRRRLGDHLQHVSVLDGLSIRVEREDVDARVVVGSLPCLVAVEDDMIAFCEVRDEVDVLPGVLLGHALDVLR
jgi:hypothetical protein